MEIHNIYYLPAVLFLFTFFRDFKVFFFFFTFKQLCGILAVMCLSKQDSYHYEESDLCVIIC